MSRRLYCLAMLVVGLAFSTVAEAQDAIRIDPQNPKYLLFRGKPLVLMSASEHYGSAFLSKTAFSVNSRG
jgi:hypothetical protein